MQDLATLNRLQHNEKLRNGTDVSLQESSLFMICCSEHSRAVLEAVQLQQRLSKAAFFISCLFYLNTGSWDWYMMPGRIGSKGNSAVTESANITWRKLLSPILCLPLSPQPSLFLFSVIQALILISPALSRFKTCFQMQRKPSILSLWQNHLSRWHAAEIVKRLTYTTDNVKRSLGCCSHTLRLFLKIGSLAFFHLPTFSGSRSWRITKHQREGPVGSHC